MMGDVSIKGLRLFGLFITKYKNIESAMYNLSKADLESIDKKLRAEGHGHLTLTKKGQNEIR